MKCEFAYCVYNRELKCILEKISINSWGMCEDCVMVALEKPLLDAEKGRQLTEIEKRVLEDNL